MGLKFPEVLALVAQDAGVQCNGGQRSNVPDSIQESLFQSLRQLT
jgi:hypothetical protein